MSLHGDLLGSLAAPPVGRCRRISSNEQPNWNDGNLDMTWFAPGQLFELPELRGPGVIEHIWMTSHAGGVGELDSLRLRIYWDGREEPGVDVPLGQFFAVGNGAPVEVESLPVQVSPSGSLTCYWRMPFARSARITVVNENPDRSTGLYWQVDWRELPELPPDTGYFHARYRQEYPAVMGRDYLIADIEGKGQYVGTVMSATMAQDGWFGEGDDFFYIDGEEIPSLQGTGSEDYEGRFIRLGIGRAVYAYRLAYDRLPDSLDELVATGIMNAYYLQDENRVPLRARRDGEYFVVESDGPNAWRHRWQGLDARR